MEAVQALLKERPWVFIAALVIGFIVRLLKDDIKGTPNVPSNRRVFIVLALGVVSGLLEKKYGPSLGEVPVTWLSGILGGFASSASAITAHNVFIDAFRGGRELPVPFLTKPGVSPSPGKPPSIPPPSPPPSPSSASEEKGTSEDKDKT